MLPRAHALAIRHDVFCVYVLVFVVVVLSRNQSPAQQRPLPDNPNKAFLPEIA